MFDKLYTIYAIQCIVNKKIYIGKTMQNLKNRLKSHLTFLRNNKHSNKFLQEDFNKYGEKNFIFYELETKVPYKNRDREKFYMDKYKTYMKENGYNKLDPYYTSKNTLTIIKGQPKNEIK